jgi:hypothetical protein
MAVFTTRESNISPFPSITGYLPYSLIDRLTFTKIFKTRPYNKSNQKESIMSAWIEGKLDLKCSIDVLRKAIVNIHPEWEEHLMVDKEGHIPMYRYNGQREYNGKGGDKEVHILIPGSGHPGVTMPPNRGAHNDWGFRRCENGQWECTFADFGLRQAQHLENQIKSEIALMKAKAIAKMRGFEVLAQDETDQEKFIDIRVDSGTYEVMTS